jgi:hypothetical protein
LSTRIPTPGELRERGFRALVRALGYADALRFLRQYESGYGDYTEERQTMLPPATAEDLTREAEALLAERRQRPEEKAGA